MVKTPLPAYTSRLMTPNSERITNTSQHQPDPGLRSLATSALARRGAPIPPALSARFDEYVDNKMRPYIHAVIFIGALGYFLFAFGDLVVAGDIFWTSLLMRAAFVATVLVLTQWLVSSGQSIYLLEAAGAFYVHVAAVIWYVVLFWSTGPEVGVYVFASVVFVLWLTIGATARFMTAVVGSCTLSGILLGGVWWLNQGDWMRLFIYNGLHMSVVVFGLVISWFNTFNQRRLFLYGIIDETKNIELQEANRLLWSQAHTDPLTGLPNRSLLVDRLTQALAAARRDGRKVALLFVDLDRFKPVNDTFGHAAGDLLLQAAANRMSTIVRSSDTVARVGGDEFVVVLPSIRTEEDAINKAAELIQTVSEPVCFEDRNIKVGCSVGIAIFPDHGEEAGVLQQVADAAVYAAKADGRNCARVGVRRDGKSAREH